MLPVVFVILGSVAALGWLRGGSGFSVNMGSLHRRNLCIYIYMYMQVSSNVQYYIYIHTHTYMGGIKGKLRGCMRLCRAIHVFRL